MEKRKILIDTDIGDDIDDAFALALALSSEEIETVGITTVFRNTRARAQQVQKLLQTMGQNVPVRAGERLPVHEPIHPFDKDASAPLETQPPCQWEKSYDSFPVREDAVDFIIEAAEKYGNELTLITIGPLTNIAKAIGKAPRSMRKIRAIVGMGGWFTNYEREWNILCDPEAADVVFSSGLPVYEVGLDVTLQCALEPDLLQSFTRSDDPLCKLLAVWLQRWFAYFSFEKSVLHDPLTVAVLIENVCRFREKYVKVNLTDNRGAIQVTDKPTAGYAPIQVATQVDTQKFYSVFKRKLLKI